jgi:hypothetical protein
MFVKDVIKVAFHVLLDNHQIVDNALLDLLCQQLLENVFQLVKEIHSTMVNHVKFVQLIV